MAALKNKSKKLLIIILCCVLAVLLATGGSLWFFLSGDDKPDSDGGKKKPSFNILTEQELLDSEIIPEGTLDEIIGDIDVEGDLSFTDQSQFEEPKVDEKPKEDEEPKEEYEGNILTVNNKTSINDSFLGFGAVYYPWIYMKDGAGRNYTEEQAKVELDRLVESGTTWIRSVIYANASWYDKDTNTWKYDEDNEKYNALVKFFKEVDKRGVDVMLNFGWGGGLNDVTSASQASIFNDNVLKAIGTQEDRVNMFTDFCLTFTQALKAEGINCVKYITFFSEPSNSQAAGGVYGTPEFETQFVGKVVPLFTKVVTNVHNAFKTAGIRDDYKFIGANQGSWYSTSSYVSEQIKPIYEPLKGILDELSYHTYNYTGTPQGATYEDFADLIEIHVQDIEKQMGIKANNTWFDEFNISATGCSADTPYDTETKQVGGIYALRNEPYTATQIGNSLLAFLNNGFKTVTMWTFTSNLWPDNTSTGSSFLQGNFMCGLMPNLLESNVPYNTYYAYSLIARYCTNLKAVYAGDMFEAQAMATSCVEDKDGNITVFVVNSSLTESEFKLKFDSALENTVMYRHVYDPLTFVGNTAAKPIGVDRVLLNVTDGFIDMIPGGAVAVYTTSKK